MGVLLVGSVLFIGVLVGVFLWLEREVEARAEVLPDDEEVLRYRVPEGQDPAALVSALAGAGFRASVAHEASDRVLVVRCPEGRQESRAAVRMVLQEARSTIQDGDVMIGEVHFDDEGRHL